MKKKYSIGILEDHIAIIMGYKSQIEANNQLDIKWTAQYYNEVDAKLAEHPTDLLILDVGVKTSPNNAQPYPILHAIPRIIEKYPGIYIVIISMHNRPALIKAIKKAGASGYILKEDVESYKKLGEILVHILRNGCYFSPKVEETISNPDEAPTLTRRQSEILSIFASNPAMETKELAEQLHVAPSTIRNHLNDIYLKLNVKRLSSAILRARTLGLITGSDTEDLPYA